MDLRVCSSQSAVTFVGGGVRGESVVIVRNNRSSLTKRGERIHPTHVARLEFPRETGLILRCAGKAGNP